jgi:AcrR family transcriptional regulator
MTSGAGLRARYPGDLRGDLMAAALDAVRETGVAHVSLRDLARRLGVSHAAPKNHFPDKRALFTALATEAHEILATELGAAVAEVPADDALARLMAGGRAYLRFAREHRGHFAVMWQEDLQDRSDPALLGASARTFGLLVELAAQVSGGVLAGRDPVLVALLAWSLAHGVADLSSGGALDDVPGTPDPVARDTALLDLMTEVLRRAVEPGAQSP